MTTTTVSPAAAAVQSARRCTAAPQDRRILRSKRALRDALIELMEERSFDGFSVNDLCERAERNLTVHELLGYRARKKPLPLLVGLFDYLREQGAFLHAVLGSGGDVGFGPRLRDSLCTNLVQSVLHERYRNDPEPFVGYYVAFFASAYLGVITRWIETGMRESSEEMALIAMRLFFIKPGESIKL